jgi:phospholipid-binding lipoprotein MlaA
MKSRLLHIFLFLILLWGVSGTSFQIPSFFVTSALAGEDIVTPPPDSTGVAAPQVTDNTKQDTEPAVAAPTQTVDQVATSDTPDAGDEAEEELVPPDQVSNNGNGLQIADPIEPFNRAMYQFNDKLYFWILKPVSTGYSKVVPEVVRVSVKNFFTNLAFPIRFVSSLLQADVKGAAQETGRFFINSIWGIAGFFDLASMEGANLPKQNSDLGETFGLWGIGQGFYIVWPVFGPSSPRDTLGTVGEFFLYPVSYLNPWYASTGVKSYEKVNDTSLRIGDYEALKGAAIDPYISIRDAYVQYRYKKIEKKRLNLWSSSPEQKEATK